MGYSAYTLTLSLSYGYWIQCEVNSSCYDTGIAICLAVIHYLIPLLLKSAWFCIEVYNYFVMNYSWLNIFCIFFTIRSGMATFYSCYYYSYYC